MRIALGFDHAGISLRERLVQALTEAGHEPLDLGNADDYPDVAMSVGRAVLDGRAERGIVVCGSGAGVAVAASKLPGIRATVAHDTYTAAQSVSHDDVNVLCLGARVIGPEIAAGLATAFAGASFSGEERHVRRLAKVAAMERDGLDAHLEVS
ncbi:MAG TPA: RpiB/LacA/LacB family sugar-phosphate isomerase [Solirubrobacteraceae bacterium]|nr:RpiB/LacA/LacB family sugar-phosphate isomerase [Solirubrobacteraceae bacterium]